MQFIDLRKAELGAGFTVGRALPTPRIRCRENACMRRSCGLRCLMNMPTSSPLSNITPSCPAWLPAEP